MPENDYVKGGIDRKIDAALDKREEMIAKTKQLSDRIKASTDESKAATEKLRKGDLT
jgi:hypothetical protein